MDLSKAAVYVTVGVILLVTVASGPLVSGYTVPEGGVTGPTPGTGNATVSVLSVPETLTLDRGEYDTGVYYLEVPAAVIDVGAVTGKPVLTYSVGIDSLQTSSSVYFLTPADTGRKRLTVDEEAFDPGEIDDRRYSGNVRIVLRGDSGSRTVYEGPVTVEVKG